MSWEFEDSEDAEDPEYLCRLGNVFHRVLGGQAVENLGEVEGKNTKDVNNVQWRKDELSLEFKVDTFLYDDLKPCERRQ